MSKNTLFPAIGSEWFEDDKRSEIKFKITVVEHDFVRGKVVITRRPESSKYRTRAKIERFWKKGGYLPWSQRENV